jgi:dolichol-phosphate mannosyltransferase
MKLSIVIPAFREEATIATVLERVAGVDLQALGVEKEIIVCDDGSTDKTAQEVERMTQRFPFIHLVQHARNQGKGAAIRTALQHATGDYVLIQDADLEYDVEDYPAMVRLAVDGALAVYGSRFLSRAWPAGMHPANYLANRILTTASNVLFGLNITDEATCFKLVRADVLRGLHLECERFEFCPEVTAKLGRQHIPVAEVPVRYQGRDVQAGKKVRWTDGVEALWVLVKYRVKR